MSFIGKSWRGEERLWIVFWLYGVVAGTAINMAGAALTVLVNPLAIIGIIMFHVVYVVWLMVAEWRCAFNVNWIGWGYIVRVWVVLTLTILLLVLAGMVLGGVLVGQDLIEAAKCRKELKERLAAGEQLDPEAFKKECYEAKRMKLVTPAAPAVQGTTHYHAPLQ